MNQITFAFAFNKAVKFFIFNLTQFLNALVLWLLSYAKIELGVLGIERHIGHELYMYFEKFIYCIRIVTLIEYPN